MQKLFNFKNLGFIYIPNEFFNFHVNHLTRDFQMAPHKNIHFLGQFLVDLISFLVLMIMNAHTIHGLFFLS